MKILMVFFAISIIGIPIIVTGNGENSTSEAIPLIKPQIDSAGKISSNSIAKRIDKNDTEIRKANIDTDEKEPIGIDRTIALVASLAALLTSFVVLLSLLEMKKQRRSSYRPDLIFGNCNYTLDFKINDLKYSRWSRFEEPDNNPEEWLFNPKELNLDCFNIGLGPAKFLKIHWIYNFQEYISLVSKRIDTDELDIVIDKEGWIFFGGSKIEQGVNLNLDLKKEIDYALPVNIASQPTEVRIPGSYLALRLIYHAYYPYFEKKANKTNIIPEPKPLELEIEYQDIENNSHSIRYEVNIRFYSIEPRDEGIRIQGYIENLRLR